VTTWSVYASNDVLIIFLNPTANAATEILKNNVTRSNLIASHLFDIIKQNVALAVFSIC
jgi:hypothetical protein